LAEIMLADATLPAWITLGLTAIGSVLALVQYGYNSKQANAQKSRERAVSAATQLERFYSDPNVKFALVMLDYQNAAFSLNYNGAQLSLGVTPELLKSALSWHVDRLVPSQVGHGCAEEVFTPTEQAVRDIFDNCFNHLERIELLIKNDVIAKADFGDLFSYWLQLIGERPLQDDSIDHLTNDLRETIWIYLRKYRYDGVIRLFERYGRAAPSGQAPNEAFVRR